MKQFFMAINRDKTCFRRLCCIFLGMSMEIKKPGIFNGPQNRQLMKDSHFASYWNQRLGQRLFW